jgi:VanZ family protein
MKSMSPFPISRYWIITIIWASLLLALSLVAVPAPKSTVVLWVDKVNHGVAYAMLAFLLILAVDSNTGDRRRFLSFVVAFVISSLWGGLTEVLQIMRSSRSAEGADLLADLIGIAAALLLYWWAIPTVRSENKLIGGSSP